MTAADIKAHIDPIRHEYADGRSLVLPALKYAQTEQGWLPPEALAAVAEATGYSPSTTASTLSRSASAWCPCASPSRACCAAATS